MKLTIQAPHQSTEHITGRRCAVLGAGGFIGSHLCRRLSELGAEVVGLGRSVTFPQAFPESARFVAAELGDAQAVDRATENADFIFHLAGSSIPQSAAHDSATDVALNVMPTLRLLEACRARPAVRFVFASSGGTVYGIPKHLPIKEDSPTDPISAYGAAKLTIEKYLAVHHRLHGLDFTVLRIANPYGPLQSPARRQGLIGALLHSALQDKPLQIWGTGEVRRDFIHVSDACDALIAAAKPGLPRVMNVGSGQGHSVNEIADAVEQVVGRPAPNRRYEAGRAEDVPVNVLDISRILGATDWRPRIALEDGLRHTAEWMREHLGSTRQDG